MGTIIEALQRAASPVPSELTDLTLRKRRCSPTRCHLCTKGHMHVSGCRAVEVVPISPVLCHSASYGQKSILLTTKPLPGPHCRP